MFNKFAKDVLRANEINEIASENGLTKNKLERWTQLEGYSKYLISSSGRIYSLFQHKLLKITEHPHTGYMKVKLRCDDGTVPTWYLHRLVASAFLPRFRGETEVNHIDGNKKNNSLFNVEWMTKEENARHAQLNGLGNCKLKPAEVRSIYYLCHATSIKQDDIADMYDVSRGVVSGIKNRRVWEYVTEDMFLTLKEGRSL